MALTREQKENLVAQYQEGLVTANHGFLIDYKGISVPEVTDLRDRVRETGAQYIVVKNRLVRRAIADGALTELMEHFEGPTAVAYSDDDPVMRLLGFKKSSGPLAPS